MARRSGNGAKSNRSPRQVKTSCGEPYPPHRWLSPSAFFRAGAADEHGIFRYDSERHDGKLANQYLVDPGRREVEASQIAMQGELGGKHLMADGAHCTVGMFGLQQARSQTS